MSLKYENFLVAQLMRMDTSFSMSGGALICSFEPIFLLVSICVPCGFTFRMIHLNVGCVTLLPFFINSYTSTLTCKNDSATFIRWSYATGCFFYKLMNALTGLYFVAPPENLKNTNDLVKVLVVVEVLGSASMRYHSSGSYPDDVKYWRSQIWWCWYSEVIVEETGQTDWSECSHCEAVRYY